MNRTFDNNNELDQHHGSIRSINRIETRPKNDKSMVLCSAIMIVLGVLLVVLGLMVMILNHLEYGPPVFDDLYERYDNSSMEHILGPMFIAFGSFIILVGLLMACYSTIACFKSEDENIGGDRYIETISENGRSQKTYMLA